MILSFQLSMPNNGSWNGKWSGDGQPYFKIRTLKKNQIEFLEGEKKKSFYYDFEDGWGANVTAEIIDSVEARKRRKASQGFCSYDWMVGEILQHGRILKRQERIKAVEAKKIIGAAPEMLEALLLIIKSQFDKESSLSNLNGAVAKARDMLKINGLYKESFSAKI